MVCSGCLNAIVPLICDGGTKPILECSYRIAFCEFINIIKERHIRGGFESWDTNLKRRNGMIFAAVQDFSSTLH